MHPGTPSNRAFETKVDSGVISMDFEVLFGRPRVRPGAPFSDLARPEAARAEKKMHKTWFQRHYGCM